MGQWKNLLYALVPLMTAAWKWVFLPVFCKCPDPAHGAIKGTLLDSSVLRWSHNGTAALPSFLSVFWRRWCHIIIVWAFVCEQRGGRGVTMTSQIIHFICTKLDETSRQLKCDMMTSFTRGPTPLHAMCSNTSPRDSFVFLNAHKRRSVNRDPCASSL